MRHLTTSPYWLFFYAFSILSFLPYFVIRFDHQIWIYNLLYRPHGIVENMTVLLYMGAVFFLGQEILKRKSMLLIILLAWTLFMIGEEVRWGLGFFVEDLHDLPLTSVQDILIFSAQGFPEDFPLFFVALILCVRVVLFCLVGGICIALWYYRHRWSSWRQKIMSNPLLPSLSVYVALMIGVIILELFIQPGPRKFDYLEENFELNAALIWLLMSFENRIP